MNARQLLEEVRARKIAELEGRPQPPPPSLQMTEHARNRALQRGFTFETILKVRQQGDVRIRKNGCRRYALGIGNRTAYLIVGKGEKVVTVYWD